MVILKYFRLRARSSFDHKFSDTRMYHPKGMFTSGTLHVRCYVYAGLDLVASNTGVRAGFVYASGA